MSKQDLPKHIPERRQTDLSLDELWQEAKAAQARQGEEQPAPLTEAQRELSRSAAELFSEDMDLSEGPEPISDYLPDQSNEKIRDFVHSLYRGDELVATRDKGDLREPKIQLGYGRGPLLDEGDETLSPESVLEAVETTQRSELSESSEASEAEPETRGQAADPKIQPYQRRRPVHESAAANPLKLELRPPKLRPDLAPASVEDMAAEFLAEQQESQEANREFEAMVDAFAHRLPEFNEDGTAAEESEQKRIGSELLNQAEYTQIADKLPPLPEIEVAEEAVAGVRQVRIRPVAEEPKRPHVQAPIKKEEHREARIDLPRAEVPERPEELGTTADREHPLFAQESQINHIRQPLPLEAEGSANLVAREIQEKREQAQRDFQEALAPLKQESIDLTVNKLQSGALAPPFYVPRLPRQSSSFAEAIEFSRRLLPLPGEMQLRQEPIHRSWLLAQLNHCSSQERLSRFAFSLNHEDLALLFPTLATLKRGKHIERILSIILMRASHYLYLHGWLTLQYAYPRSTVEKGLSELCAVLDDASFMSREMREQEREYLAHLHLGDEQFVWTRVRHISEIAVPNQRHFISKITTYMRENDYLPEEFFKEFAIYADLPLGRAIMSAWNMELIEDKARGGSGFSPRQLLSQETLS